MAGMEIIPNLSNMLILFAGIASLSLVTMIFGIVLAQVFDGLFDG